MRAIWITLSLLLTAGSAPAETVPSTLDDWLAVAESGSPVLRAASARTEAARHAADGAGSWTGPLIGYGWFLEPVQTRVGPQEHKLSITQALPVFGRNGLRGDAAAAEVSVEEGRVDLAREELRYRLIELWNELWLLRESASIASSDLQLIEELHGSALGRYRAGRTSQAAVVRIELERERLADDLRRLQAARVPLLARINAELGREPDAPIEGGGVLARAGVQVPSLAELRSKLPGSATVTVAGSRTVAAQSRVELADRDRWPTLAIGADWILTGEAVQPGLEGSGRDAVMLRAAVRLPWPSGGRADQAERQAAVLAAARAEESRVGLAAGARLEQAWFDYAEATRRSDLLEQSLIPAADLALTVSSSSFAAGETGIGDLIEIHRTRLDLALELARASVQRANGIARLELLTSSTFSAPEGH